MKWIKSHALLIALIFIVIGMVLIFHTNKYGISSETISCVVDGEVIEKIIYSFSQNRMWLRISSTVFMSLGVALFISAFFIRYIEGDERKAFEEKLLSFQENTAKDAIQSVFKRIVDEEFFEIIKKDLLDAKAIRKNANWQYDITKLEDGNMLLKRTISYEFHNRSYSVATELLKLVGNNNAHCATQIISGKIRHPSGKEESIDLRVIQDETGESFTNLEKEIEIQAGDSIEVVLVFQQTFKNGYIYETHNSRHPIINLEITVNHPADYRFDLFSSFSNKERIRINEPDKKVYVVEGAIFTGQGVEFVCEKINDNSKKANQNLEPIVTTPVDEVEAQSTQAHV